MHAAAPLDEELEALLAYLRDERGADFTGYKRPSLTRLINRRMRTAGVDTYGAYVDLLQVEPVRAARRCSTCCSSTSRPSSATRPRGRSWPTSLLPEVLAAARPGRAGARLERGLRVRRGGLQPGDPAPRRCSVTSEYKRRVKIYATDIDEQALAVARPGRYTRRRPGGPDRRAARDLLRGRRPAAPLPRGPAALRSSSAGTTCCRTPPSRACVLLSCRNVLMYFTAETQTRVLERFSFALHEHGLLLLGKAEMLLTQSQLFTPVSLSQRIFRARRRSGAGRLAALGRRRAGPGGRPCGVRPRPPSSPRPAAQVVLDATGTVVLLNDARPSATSACSGRTSAGCSQRARALPPTARAARRRSARCRRAARPAEIRDVAWTPPGAAPGRWDIRIAPLHRRRRGARACTWCSRTSPDRHELQLRLGHLDGELTTAYEELQSSSEELETTNEELQSAVEELETTNEELQSTNEELETMNEELQSTNEELQTLNDELRDRTLEVDRGQRLPAEHPGRARPRRRRRRHRVARAAVERRRRAADRGCAPSRPRAATCCSSTWTLPVEQVRAALRSVVIAGEVPAPVDVDLTDRFGRPQRRRLTATPLLRGRTARCTGRCSRSPTPRHTRTARRQPRLSGWRHGCSAACATMTPAPQARTCRTLTPHTGGTHPESARGPRHRRTTCTS